MPALDTSVSIKAGIQAPMVVHCPSLSSLVSTVSLSPSEASTGTAASMARSQSLLSSTSNGSASTVATSIVASSSCSNGVMDRKRPVSNQRDASSQIIKLRASRSNLNFGISVQEATPKKLLLQRSSISSLHSQTASIYSPTSSEVDIMVRPMDALPSPVTSASEKMRSSPSTFSSVSVAAASRDTRATLYDIWTAAEEAERFRRASSTKKLVKKSASSMDLKNTRVSTWVNKIRSSASSVNLRRDIPKKSDHDMASGLKQLAVPAVSSDAGQTLPESCFEPEVKRRMSIEQLLCPPQAKAALPRLKANQGKPQDPVWSFLG